MSLKSEHWFQSWFPPLGKVFKAKQASIFSSVKWEYCPSWGGWGVNATTGRAQGLDGLGVLPDSLLWLQRPLSSWARSASCSLKALLSFEGPGVCFSNRLSRLSPLITETQGIRYNWFRTVLVLGAQYHDLICVHAVK